MQFHIFLYVRYTRPMSNIISYTCRISVIMMIKFLTTFKMETMKTIATDIVTNCFFPISVMPNEKHHKVYNNESFENSAECFSISTLFDKIGNNLAHF